MTWGTNAWADKPFGWVPAAGGGTSGTVAYTNANDSVSASGTTTVTGFLAKTNANDSVVASGIAGSVTGTVAVTNANDTVSASGDAGATDTHDGFWAKQWQKIREREKKSVQVELAEEIEQVEQQISEVKAVKAIATKVIAKAKQVHDYAPEQAQIIAALMAHRANLIEQEDEELLLLL